MFPFAPTKGMLCVLCHNNRFPPPLFLLSWEPVGSCCFPATVPTRSFPFAQLSAQGMRASAAGHRFIPTVIHAFLHSAIAQ